MSEEVIENDFIFKAHVFKGSRAMEIRKFAMKPEDPFRILEEKLRGILNNFGDTRFKLLYKDNNNDFITMTTADEYQILKWHLVKREVNDEYHLYIVFEDEFAPPAHDYQPGTFICGGCERQVPFLCAACRNHNERINDVNGEENRCIRRRTIKPTPLNITEPGNNETAKVTNNARQNGSNSLPSNEEASGLSQVSSGLFSKEGICFDNATNIMTVPKATPGFKFTTQSFDNINNKSLFNTSSKDKKPFS